VAHREGATLTGINTWHLRAGQPALTLTVIVAVPFALGTGPTITAIIQMAHGKRATNPLICSDITKIVSIIALKVIFRSYPASPGSIITYA
jgi:hypothetical protein